MANGRQRRAAAQRQRKARMEGLNGLSADVITQVVSDDDNDLDQVQYTTTDGAQVSVKNQRGKTDDGQVVTPNVKMGDHSGIGQPFSGGSLQNLPEPEPELPKQPDAITAFIGEDLGPNTTATYEILDEAPAPGLYDNVAPGKEVALTGMDAYANTAPNLSTPTDEEIAKLNADSAARQLEEQQLADMGVESRDFDKSRGIDPSKALAPEVFSEPTANLDFPEDVDLKEDKVVNTGEIVDLAEAPVINAEDLTKKADDEIMAATAGKPEITPIVNETKSMIEQIKSSVETGETTIKEAMDAMGGAFSQLGELLGVDGKDVTRALFRYAGGRIFGMSGNSAARFAYDEWSSENSDTVLGKNATAKQRNHAAYKKEIARIEEDASLTMEQKASAKKTANEIYGVGKSGSMGRPVNIKGIVGSTGAEEVVAGRRNNERNSYDVFLDGQWVPVEESGLEEIQITGRGAEQAFEQGVKDPRTGKGIDNASHVSSTGVPTFSWKTQDQRKGYQLAKRSVDSFPVIENMLSNPENIDKLTSALGGLQSYAAGHANDKVTAASINLALGDELPQKFKSATSAWLQSLLRADTGAAYSETEIMDYIATNIPQVGDDPETVKFKLQQMKSTTETMAANTGPGAKYLLGRLDGSIEAPDAVKRMHEMGKIGEKKTTTKRSADLQSALDLY